MICFTLYHTCPPMRARYGVSFVNIYTDLFCLSYCNAASCYIGPYQNGTRLYKQNKAKRTMPTF